jgi:hypothetical protein
MMQSAQKKKSVTYKNENVLEALGSIPGSIGTQTTQEVGKIGTDIFTALLGGMPKSGNLEPNQAIEFGQPHVESAPQPVSIPRMEAQPRPNVTELEAQTREQIQVIREELKALAKSLKSLNQEVQTAISEEPVNPGIYHMNFYDQLRSFISVLRQQVEDSRSWLSTFNSRKKKVGYWGMYKKHGTTFGLSSERSLATSAG